MSNDRIKILIENYSNQIREAETQVNSINRNINNLAHIRVGLEMALQASNGEDPVIIKPPSKAEVIPWDAPEVKPPSEADHLRAKIADLQIEMDHCEHWQGLRFDHLLAEKHSLIKKLAELENPPCEPPEKA